MNSFLDRFTYFTKTSTYSHGHGEITTESRRWEDAYRQRWQHDKIVRSTHGVNCTGSCSWKIYVKGGLVTWETQQTDYPQTRPDMPNHEPRGCARGASYSWYMYSAARLKYPLIRTQLVRLWCDAKQLHADPVNAWESIVSNPDTAKSYKSSRGMGGFVRANWDLVNEIIAAANIYTIKQFGPDRIIGFSPIPAMSMISYAAGSRYLSLIGGTCMSFYDWYCDLPPSSPQTWGEQTDVPESADWYNSTYLLLWGSNVPQTRTPDAHFYTEVRYKGAKSVVISPDYSEAAKFADLWLSPRPGTDAALAMAMGHVILKKFHLDNPSEYFQSYCKQYSDMPFLVKLKKQGDGFVADRLLRASDFIDNSGVQKNADWIPALFDESESSIALPNGTIGSRWDNSGRWNLELKDIRDGKEIKPCLSLIDKKDDIVRVGFPCFIKEDILWRNLPVKKLQLVEGETFVTTVFDLLIANYGINRGLGDEHVAKDFSDNMPYTPAWQESITGVKQGHVIAIAQEFAENAMKTEGRSIVILGAGLNHWYHMDMVYRAIINLLVMCGCVGKSGGGWAHYVGQEKLRPQTGWLPLAFGLDWCRPPRQMNSTSFFYAHTNQWRYEKLQIKEILSPLADKKQWQDLSLIDCNVKAERAGWLPSAPQLQDNPIQLSKIAVKAGKDIKEFIIEKLKNNELTFSCEDPNNPKNFPRNLFVWRANLLGSSGKGHEYFLKYLLGTQHGIQGKDLGDTGQQKPKEVVWHDIAPEGTLDLLVGIDFRMSTTCLYSDIVLPTATWYEKNDLSTSDMHPFIHPLSAAVDPAWECRSDWDIYKNLAKIFSTMAKGHLDKEQDIVLTPLLHDTPGELGQAQPTKDWKYGECDPIPGKTMPNINVVERDYTNIYKQFTSVGPLIKKCGNGAKGLNWNTADELEHFNHVTHGTIETDLDAAEFILTLAPETNGEVAVKAWRALEEKTGRTHTHLATPRQAEKIKFKDLQAQPRKIISSPIWSGVESEEISYSANYTNVHELIPWRTLTGRQQLYQDHPWMLAFGESLCVYKPLINTKSIETMSKQKNNSSKYIALNFITPHQKWGIHSTFSDNLIMLTLNRGGPVIWLSESDAAKIGVVDNDWVELCNANGALVARAVVSQRIPEGSTFMYHAQEKTINVPISETTQHRGGIHNSVTRICIKPTHMIGGYAQQSYGFNYYGTVGSNRDEFVIVSKLENVQWTVNDAIEEKIK